MKNKIILFDGICNLCNSSVNFIIDRDKKGIFKFAPLQSETGKKYIEKYNIENENLKTLILIENEKFSLRSSAALRIAKYLIFPWNLSYIFIVTPPFIRNFIYNFISKHRYKWFGKRETCRVPTPELKDKFL